MVRMKVTLSFGLLALLCTIQGSAPADVIHLSSGQRLTAVQVLSTNWKGYEVQLTADVTIFFARDEIVGVERDNIEPGRAARRGQTRVAETPTQPAAFRGVEVSPELSALLQSRVKVRFENKEISVILRSLSEVYGVNIELDPALLRPGGLDDTTWTVNFEDAKFITVIEQLVIDKGLDYRIEGENIILYKPASPSPAAGNL